MFEFIRTHKRLMQFFLLILIVPSFVLVGVSSYKNGGAAANEVAIVDGQKITQIEFEQAQRQQMDRFRGMLGDKFDPKMFETAEAKQAILENLVAERTLNAEIAREHLTVDDATLQKSILEINAFKRPDGSFDMEQYKSALAMQGMSPAMFDARMRHDLALQQLNGAIQNTAFAPRSVAARLSDINDQEREVQELILPVADFTAQAKVSDEMVKAYYEKNAAMFQLPEQAKVEYVVFDAAAVESLVSVSDAEVADAYKANLKKFTTPEQRSASHILVNVKKGMSSAEKAAAKAKAEAILAEVKKAPADFAKIATAKSEDASSAQAGGDLGVIERGALPSAVENAIDKLKEGEIAGPVESDFGYHIVKLTKLVPATVRPLEEAKTEIASELKKQKMSNKYKELAEQFTDTLFEQADSLKPVADKLKLKVETVSNLSRTPSPVLGNAPYNNAKFLKAVFTDEVIKNKHNSEAVEVAPTTLIAGRVVDYKPAAKRPLAEVDSVIRQRVTMEEAAKLAKKAGEAKIAAAKASGDAAGFGEVKTLTRTKAPTINPTAATEVLKADVSKLPAYVGVELPGQGYGVYRIGKVSMPAQPDVARRESEAQQISGAVGQEEMFAYLEALKKKAKAKVTGTIAETPAAK
jgi:peptidyl-prolyl cis-trans isomerase D